MLLSIVVHLLSSINGTQSASQAASPLILSWSDPALLIPTLRVKGFDGFHVIGYPMAVFENKYFTFFLDFKKRDFLRFLKGRIEKS